MAKRIRWPALGFGVALGGAAYAGGAPLDLQQGASPAKSEPAKSEKGAKSGPSANLSAAEAVRGPTPGSIRRAVLTADFVQIGPDGKRSEGQLTVLRPGHMLFKYAQPPGSRSWPTGAASP